MTVYQVRSFVYYLIEASRGLIYSLFSRYPVYIYIHTYTYLFFHTINFIIYIFCLILYIYIPMYSSSNTECQELYLFILLPLDPHKEVVKPLMSLTASPFVEETRSCRASRGRTWGSDLSFGWEALPGGRPPSQQQGPAASPGPREQPEWQPEFVTLRTKALGGNWWMGRENETDLRPND